MKPKFQNEKKIITLLFVFTVINIFGQTPATSNPVKANSNNKILPPSEMVANKVIKPLTKVALDKNSILVYDYDGSLFSYNLESEKLIGL